MHIPSAIQELAVKTEVEEVNVPLTDEQLEAIKDEYIAIQKSIAKIKAQMKAEARAYREQIKQEEEAADLNLSILGDGYLKREEKLYCVPDYGKMKMLRYLADGTYIDSRPMNFDEKAQKHQLPLEFEKESGTGNVEGNSLITNNDVSDLSGVPYGEKSAAYNPNSGTGKYEMKIFPVNGFTPKESEASQKLEQGFAIMEPKDTNGADIPLAAILEEVIESVEDLEKDLESATN